MQLNQSRSQNLCFNLFLILASSETPDWQGSLFSYSFLSHLCLFFSQGRWSSLSFCFLFSEITIEMVYNPIHFQCFSPIEVNFIAFLSNISAMEDGVVFFCFFENNWNGLQFNTLHLPQRWASLVYLANILLYQYYPGGSGYMIQPSRW